MKGKGEAGKLDWAGRERYLPGVHSQEKEHWREIDLDDGSHVHCGLLLARLAGKACLRGDVSAMEEGTRTGMGMGTRKAGRYWRRRKKEGIGGGRKGPVPVPVPSAGHPSPLGSLPSSDMVQETERTTEKGVRDVLSDTDAGFSRWLEIGGENDVPDAGGDGSPGALDAGTTLGRWRATRSFLGL
jgi:hypothetical protein